MICMQGTCIDLSVSKKVVLGLLRPMCTKSGGGEPRTQPSWLPTAHHSPPSDGLTVASDDQMVVWQFAGCLSHAAATLLALSELLRKHFSQFVRFTTKQTEGAIVSSAVYCNFGKKCF